MTDITEDDYLAHYGILRKSGRYPWGSGGTPEQRSRSFLGIVKSLEEQGLTAVEIAAGFSTPEHKFTTTDLRATKTMARNAKKAADIAQAQMYKEKGYSNGAIGVKLGEPGKPLNESTVRSLLAPGANDRNNRLLATANMLREEVANKGMVDIGKGNEHHLLGVNANSLGTAVALLKAEGYAVHTVQVDTIGSAGNKTLVKVLAPPGTEYKDIVSNIGQVKNLGQYTENNGRSFSHILPPVSISKNRVAVVYKEDGGDAADGVMFIRPGKKDLDLGAAHYAQVRVMVDGTHYLKGMAMYKEDLPPGVDIAFNTAKSKTDPKVLANGKVGAMKPLRRKFVEGDDPKDPNKWTGEVDQENPFGSIVRQIGIRDKEGRLEKVTSALNLVNEEGEWDKWSRNISAQMLSKQKPSLVKERLEDTYHTQKEGLDEILALNNPAVKRKLLESYADGLDAKAIHLKAAGLPRQRTQVILPMNSMKPNEVYAPNFRDGEKVVLIRYPHGGTFEIPELTVNNRHREARRLLGDQPKDAIAIHSKVAKKLSGADFDGDTVVVIPNNNRKITATSSLKELEHFDPQSAYPSYPGMPKLSPQYKQKLMGEVSNLITDMTIKGANDHEIAQAVKHSMVVIDAEKHNLNWRQSAIDNNIKSLRTKYQSGPRGGASTLISQAKSPIRVNERKLRKASEGGSVDPVTGKKIYKETGKSWPDPKDPSKTVYKKSSVKKLEYFEDAHDLSSGTPVEKLYADHSNRMKALANETRLAALKTGNVPYSESANRVYAKEVAQLNSKLNLALKNAPRERQAQIIARAKIDAVKKAGNITDKAELKKLESLALIEARNRTGAKKTPVYVEDSEWEAIQAGALRHTKLKAILDNADLKRVTELATPRTQVLMTPAKKAKAQRLLASGATQADIADALGVSLSTLKKFLNG